MGTRWTCIHVLIHVHILITLWDLTMGDWNMQIWQHRGTCFYNARLCEGSGSEMGIHVNMNMCTDT